MEKVVHGQRQIWGYKSTSNLKNSWKGFLRKSSAKNWLIGKDPDAGKNWRQEKGMTEDEIVGWHHWLDGHEFEQALADGERHKLACYSPWGHKESHTTEHLNNRNWWLRSLRLRSKESTCNAEAPGSISRLGRSLGEGNGSPLQYYCLENSMDSGAWHVTVHGFAKRHDWVTNTNWVFNFDLMVIFLLLLV